MVARVKRLGIEVGFRAEFIIFAGTGARRKGESDQSVSSEGSSLKVNEGRKVIKTGSRTDVNGPG